MCLVHVFLSKEKDNRNKITHFEGSWATWNKALSSKFSHVYTYVYVCICERIQYCESLLWKVNSSYNERVKIMNIFIISFSLTTLWKLILIHSMAFWCLKIHRNSFKRLWVDALFTRLIDFCFNCFYFFPNLNRIRLRIYD